MRRLALLLACACACSSRPHPPPTNRHRRSRTTRARELGVIFANPGAAATIAGAFTADWSHAIAIPDPPPACVRPPGAR